ncbi:MAG: hypothetical protein AVO39_11070 [delta proteobacterium MLS_D]|nr:MAG: hypothetical protein AVO39_11070 [delta proteobacterium MLS_D]
MDYATTISLTEDEAAVLAEIAVEAGKTPQQVIDELGGRIVDQIQQWIKDRYTTEISKQPIASAYLRLKEQQK